MKSCDTCGAMLDDSEESLHFDCGERDCLWCLARAGDCEAQARVQNMFMRDCITEMNTAIDDLVRDMEQVGLPETEFRQRLLEQWRPW